MTIRSTVPRVAWHKLWQLKCHRHPVSPEPSVHLEYLPLTQSQPFSLWPVDSHYWLSSCVALSHPSHDSISNSACQLRFTGTVATESHRQESFDAKSKFCRRFNWRFPLRGGSKAIGTEGSRQDMQADRTKAKKRAQMEKGNNSRGQWGFLTLKLADQDEPLSKCIKGCQKKKRVEVSSLVLFFSLFLFGLLFFFDTLIMWQEGIVV